ncbi:MAG TPA: tetratricopeptide repeat protein, partial [Rugosimonospora sp.]
DGWPLALGKGRSVTDRGPERLALAVLVAVLALAVGLAGNEAASQARWPGVLDVARRHPWPALGILALIAVMVEMVLWLWRERESDRTPGAPGTVMRVGRGATVVVNPDPPVPTGVGAAASTGQAPPATTGGGAEADDLTQITAPGRQPAGGAPRQLPATTSVFTGRENELAELLALADRASAGDNPGTVVISAIDGMAGIGKTALAIHAGHRLAARFPDGQLFLDLHGYTQGLDPRDPADALASVMRDLGVPPEQVPADLDALCALYRERLAGTRTLILLDNAAGETQVRPLLPGEGGCLVVVTSRKRLKALDDAHALPLDVLPMPDAVALFREVAGPGRTEPNDPLLEEIATLCGRLPFALRIAAALIRASRAWDLVRLADRLREHRPGGELDGFSDGDRDLTAVFALSQRTLAADRQRLFRLLGVVPAPDIDSYAAAALLDTGPTGAERLLQDLVDHNLLTEPSPGRYRMHDLIRRHARSLAEHDPADQRDAARQRLLDYYRHTAGRADARITRHTRPEPTDPAPAHTPALPDPDTALAWLRAERANLLACIELAGRRDWDGRVVALSSGLATLLRTDGPFPQALTVHTTALAAAERLDDRPGQANALAQLGAVRHLTGDLPSSMRDLEAALQLYRDLSDRHGQADALAQLGAVRHMTGDYPGATRDLEAALQLYQDLGHRPGQARALNQLGSVWHLTGDYPRAMRDLEAALQLYQDLSDRHGRANALTQLAAVRQLIGDLPGATRDLEAALQLYQDLGHRLGQARALTQLGDVRHLTGDYPGATRDLEAALQLLHRDLGHRLGRANVLTVLGTVRRSTGDYPGAMLALEAALELYRETGSRGNEAWALNHYAAVFTAAGDPARAEALYRDALRLAREVQQPDDEALALEGIGECRLHEGDNLHGATHLTQALEIFQRLAMRPDADRIQARLTELGPR